MQMSRTSRTYKGKAYRLPFRDTYRERCYRAERAAFPDRAEAHYLGTDLAASVEFTNRVVRSATWKRLRGQFGMLREDGSCWIADGKGVEVLPGRGHRRATAWMDTINLPLWARNKPVILHELAHVLVGGGVQHHWPWARAFIGLVSAFMGAEDARRLERCLRKERARVSPPREMSEEAKRRLAERGRAALAAWAARKQGGAR